MSLTPKFQTQNFDSKLLSSDIRFSVDAMRWAAVGGCMDATITAKGNPLDLWEFTGLLRGGVIIEDELAQAAWWGTIEEILIRVGKWEIGMSLKNMANAVAVAYSYVAPGSSTVGIRKTTAWATDSISVTEYGRKDFLSSQSGLSDGEAINRRDSILNAQKRPMGIANPYAGIGREPSATIKCKGWMDTLSWRMASVTTTASTVTTTQIANLVSTYGQFLAATDIDAASGISSSEYRKGDKNCLYEVQALLKSGGANQRRLLASVDQNRRLQVWEEPDNSSILYGFDAKGNLLNQMQNLVPGYLPPVGKWVQLVDVIPGTVDVTKLVDPSIQFLEEATWNQSSGLQPRFRGQPGIDDLFRVQ